MRESYCREERLEMHWLMTIATQSHSGSKRRLLCLEGFLPQGRALLRTKMVTVAFVVVELSPNPGAISIPCGDKAREVCGTPLAYNVFSSVANEGRGRVREEGQGIW